MAAVVETCAKSEDDAAWYYEFDINGRLTAPTNPADVIRHRQRRSYIFDPIRELCGGSLSGMRVLDLGCNEGFFLLYATQLDCAFTLGIDLSPIQIGRAKSVFETNKVPSERYDFRCEDFFTTLTRDEPPFDIVLALGVLHWIDFRQHITFLEGISARNSDLIVIDTVISTEAGPILELYRRRLGKLDPQSGESLRILPSAEGLIEIMRAFGYEGKVLKPRFAEWEGSQDYRDGSRRAFIFAKRSTLQNLSTATESPSKQHHWLSRLSRRARSAMFSKRW